MKKILYFIPVMAIILSLASIGYASGIYQMVGRELSPGIESDGVFYGALFLGKIFDEDSEAIGSFSVLLNRVDEGVEECGGTTEILKFKLVMNFNDGSRLVLLSAPAQETAAYWDFDDPAYPEKHLFYSYSDFLVCLQNPLYNDCGEDGVSLIAQVGPFNLQKQRWGSWGEIARSITSETQIVIDGWLVHIPLVPIVVGTVTLNDGTP